MVADPGTCYEAGVIAAAALKCMGASIQARLQPRNEDELRRTLEAGYDVNKVRGSA